MTNIKLYKEIEAEVVRSTAKHGANLTIPSLDPILINRDSLRMAQEYEMPSGPRAKSLTDIATSRGQLTHAHIVVEELAEAIECMTDEDQMRQELIQLACTVVKWINAIDHKKQTV